MISCSIYYNTYCVQFSAANWSTSDGNYMFSDIKWLQGSSQQHRQTLAKFDYLQHSCIVDLYCMASIAIWSNLSFLQSTRMHVMYMLWKLGTLWLYRAGTINCESKFYRLTHGCRHYEGLLSICTVQKTVMLVLNACSVAIQPNQGLQT